MAEREALKIERDAADVCSAFLLERVLAEGGPDAQTFDGEVVGVIGKGAFVRFGEKGFEGFLPARRIGGSEWFSLNEQETALVGEESGRSLPMGGVGDGRGRAHRRSARAGGSHARGPRPKLAEGRADGQEERQAQGGARRRRHQPPGLLPLRAARPLGVRDRADGSRGQVAARGRRPAQGRLRVALRGRAVAAPHVHRALPAGGAREPRARACTQAATAQTRTRAPRRLDEREGLHAGADPRLLPRAVGQGRDRPRARQDRHRPAPRHQGARAEARDRPRARRARADPASAGALRRPARAPWSPSASCAP